jgi:hypothetical protein
MGPQSIFVSMLGIVILCLLHVPGGAQPKQPQTAVQAQQPPQYDPGTYCKAIAGVTSSGSTRDLIIKQCLMQEERRANQIRRSLASFSHETIDRCDALARASTGGSYQMFAGCLAMDIADRFLEGKIDIVERKPTR